MQLSALDLNLLPVLGALLDTASVKRAASRVSLSPSATSHALSRLRETFNDPLLVRAGRRLQLTPRAEALRPELKRVLEQVEGMISKDAPFDAAQLRRSFYIAGTDYVEIIFAPTVERQAARQAPGVNLYLPRLQDTVEQLRNGSCDFVIGVSRALPDDIHSHHLLHERFVCLMRDDHPASQRNLTLRRYASLQHLLVAPGGKPRGVVDDQLAKLGLQRRISRTVASFAAAPFSLLGTDLVLTVAERIARLYAGQLGLVIRKPPLQLDGFDLHLHWHRRYDDDAANRWLRDAIISASRKL